MPSKKLLIIGTGSVAAVACSLFEQDTSYHVSAFVEDTPKQNTFMGRPVFASATILEHFSPNVYDFHVGIGYSKMNSIRELFFLRMCSLGYTPASYISSSARINKDTHIGRHVFIGDMVTLQPWARIEDNVTILPGTIVGHHSTIEENAYLCQGVNIPGYVTIGKNSFIATGAIFTDGVKIGKICFIGASACVHKDMPENTFLDPKTMKAKDNAALFFEHWYSKRVHFYDLHNV